ncbi:MAG: hypothetical protein ABJB55_09530 [Actinomycetota bacterium]
MAEQQQSRDSPTRDFLAVNLIISNFAYANRLADGLGIGIEGDDDKVGW